MSYCVILVASMYLVFQVVYLVCQIKGWRKQRQEMLQEWINDTLAENK